MGQTVDDKRYLYTFSGMDISVTGKPLEDARNAVVASTREVKLSRGEGPLTAESKEYLREGTISRTDAEKTLLQTALQLGSTKARDLADYSSYIEAAKKIADAKDASVILTYYENKRLKDSFDVMIKAFNKDPEKYGDLINRTQFLGDIIRQVVDSAPIKENEEE